MTITALGIGTLQNISLLHKIQRLKRDAGLRTPSNTPICYENDLCQQLNMNEASVENVCVSPQPTRFTSNLLSTNTIVHQISWA